MKKTFFIILYLWAFGFHSLLWLHMYTEGTRIDLAVVTMALGLLTLWGGLLAAIQWRLMRHISIRVRSFRYPVLASFLMMVGLALIAEVVSTTMTNTAPLWGLSTDEAFITASANWWVVVSRHSVIVFLPQLWMVSWLHQHLSLRAFHWFIVYGLIGYVNEWLAFGEAASWVSVPFWMIIYGWIVYLPTTIVQSKNTRQSFRWSHSVLAFIGPLLLSMPWALFVHWLFLSG